jgi:hypothetical protein
MPKQRVIQMANQNGQSAREDSMAMAGNTASFWAFDPGPDAAGAAGGQA